MPKKNDNPEKANVHEELDGFNPKINEFGEIVSYDVNKINEFLNENVADKKLQDPGAEEGSNTEEE